MKRKIWISFAALSLVAAGALGACSDPKPSLGVGQAVYYAEYGESFLLPDPVIANADEDEVSFVVKDASGKEVTKAQLGSFYPELGEYTLTFMLGELTATAKIVCADTKGPSVEYTDYVRTVFEGDEFTVPVFVASDISGIESESESLKIYEDEQNGREVTAEDGKLVAAQGVEAYLFEYKVEDTQGNESVTLLKTEVKENFVDTQLAAGTMWDFDEAGYINLIGEHPSADTKTAAFSLTQNEPEGVRGGALKLSCSEDGSFAGVKLLRGAKVNTGDISRIVIRMYADNDVSIFSVGSLREDIANVEFADLEKNVWHTLEINPRALHPDHVDVETLEISFRNVGTTNVYIDEIYAVPFYEDENLAEGCLGDFDEEGYLANIEQAGYDIGKGLISAKYEIISKENLPEGELRDGALEGGVLKVDCEDLWTEDYGGYGVLGDGVKYYFEQPVNTADINQLFIKIYCADGADMALSFCYQVPGGKVMRSKARWLRGAVGEWKTINISYEQIVQIVPMYEVTDDNHQPITDFDLTAIVITSCGNVPDHTTPCKQFYLDEITFVGDFYDTELEEGYLADFDESGYISRLDQAWQENTNTAVYKVLAEGDPEIPEGASGGVVKVTAKQTEDYIIPYQGARGDGIRFYFFDSVLFSDLDSVTVRAYGAPGQGTAVNVGFILIRDGKQIRSNAWWQQVSEGSWTDITLNKQRLSLSDVDATTGAEVPRLLPDDEIIGICIWACGVQSGLDFAKEFYIDSIRYTKTGGSSELPDPVLPDNCLIDFGDANDAQRLSQSMDMWPGQQNGGAEYAIIARENEAQAKIYSYEWFNTDRAEAFKAFEGSVLEVVSRTGMMDGVKVTFYKAFSFEDMSALKVTMFSASANGGYVFYVYDSEGNTYTWRVQTTDYTAYQWSELSLDVSLLKAQGLKDISAIAFTYACGTNISYAYFRPIYLAKAAEPAPEVPDNVLTDFGGESDASGLSQSTDMWPGQQNGGAEYAIIARENEAQAKIYSYEWFTAARAEAFKAFEGSILEVVSRTGMMDGAKVTFDTPYSYEGAKTLDVTMYSNSANGGYVFYIADSEGKVYTWRITTADYTIYEWNTLSLDVSLLKEAGLKDIASVSFTYACGSNVSYLYIDQIAFTPAEEQKA